MRVTEQTNVTDKNLDRLADFLNRELERPALAEQIPEGAHIFHGSYNDATLTQANLKLKRLTFSCLFSAGGNTQDQTPLQFFLKKKSLDFKFFFINFVILLGSSSLWSQGIGE